MGHVAVSMGEKLLQIDSRHLKRKTNFSLFYVLANSAFYRKSTVIFGNTLLVN